MVYTYVCTCLEDLSCSVYNGSNLSAAWSYHDFSIVLQEVTLLEQLSLRLGTLSEVSTLENRACSID